MSADVSESAYCPLCGAPLSRRGVLRTWECGTAEEFVHGELGIRQSEDCKEYGQKRRLRIEEPK
jgi:ribosomal protein L37AE/L43A